MSVYIKGMEMPTSCGECELCACYVLEDGTEENYRCTITMYPIRNFDERHERCPLITVPDHRRLIDAENLCELCDIMADKCDGIGESIWNQFRTTVEWCPTIIPADKEEQT